jgi:large subunit ribosomal protein L28
MAKCFFCKKQQVSGNKVSHSNIKTRTKNNPNVQRLRAVVDKKIQRIYACTRCIRSGKVTRPTPRSAQPQAL